jgi:superoxide dismutase, Fe-Mn family
MSSNKKENKLSEDLIASIREGLSLKPLEKLNESFVVQAKKFDLSTELLSEKSKQAQQKTFESIVESLNKTSAKLDTANREEANSISSDFRSLKSDEIYGLNSSFLHGMYFENISDPHSKISMDSISYLRLERDFGDFDAWQKDFIACCLSSRDGWALTVYNGFLNRYMSVVIDSNNVNVPINCYPVIVMKMQEDAYYRDYLTDKKSYVFGMMKQFNWSVIEDRFKKSEKIAKVLK